MRRALQLEQRPSDVCHKQRLTALLHRSLLQTISPWRYTLSYFLWDLILIISPDQSAVKKAQLARFSSRI